MKQLLVVIVTSASLLACNQKDSKSKAKRQEYFAPDLGSVHFNLITPPADYLCKVNCAEARWSPQNAIDSSDGVVVHLSYIKLYYGSSKDTLSVSSEEILFENLRLREELEIHCDVHGVHSIYRNHQFDGEFESHEFNNIASVDSVLKIWNQMPLREWSASEQKRYKTVSIGCFYESGTQPGYLVK